MNFIFCFSLVGRCSCYLRLPDWEEHEGVGEVHHHIVVLLLPHVHEDTLEDTEAHF